MKRLTLSLVSILALSGVPFAGGDIAPIEESIAQAPVEVSSSAFYIGLGYSYLSSNRTAWLNNHTDPRNGQIVKDTDSNANNILLQAGYQVNQYFAIEGRYTLSAGDFSLAHNHNDGLEEDADIDLTNIAIYLKPIYPIGDLSIYGLLGYGKVEREFNQEPHHSWDGSGFQWGLGVQYTIKENLSIFADYTLWYDEDGEAHERLPRLLDTDFSVISIGLTYKF
ncbi:MAG: porin family protein [Campylobacterota bacterium]|nr:porin family protein [Campylobacterota bacterium]